MYSKFFDNKGPLPHHVHHREQHAKLVGQMGKPESYFFPVQLNNYGARFSLHVLRPGARDAPKTRCASACGTSPRATTRSPTSPPPTGWSREPAGTSRPGILHAPGSLCTYEPQKASDVFAMYQSLSGDAIIPEELLWKNTPKDKVGDIDYLIEVAGLGGERGSQLRQPTTSCARSPFGRGADAG